MDRSRQSASYAQSRSGSRKPFWWLLVVVIVLVGGSLWFLLAGHSDVREKLVAQIEGSAVELASSVYDRLGGQPPAPEVGSTAGDSLPGAPPHREDPNERYDSLDAAMTEGTVQEGGAAVRGPLSRTETAIPEDAGRKDDSVVRIAFIDDLARWLRQNYIPTGRSGVLTSSLREANLRYGVGMRGLAWIGDDLPAGRSAALAHVYTRDMLSSLYSLYIDRFMEAVARSLDEPVDGRTLSPEQKRRFYLAYAGQFRSLSGTLQGIVALPDFTVQMNDLQQGAQRVVAANARYSELVFARDAAQEQGNSGRVAELGVQVAEAGKIYQQAVVSREQSREALAQTIRIRGNAGRMDTDSILYVAAWVERRVRNHPEKMDATRQAAALFLDLAQRFESAGQEAVKVEAE